MIRYDDRTDRDRNLPVHLIILKLYGNIQNPQTIKSEHRPWKNFDVKEQYADQESDRSGDAFVVSLIPCTSPVLTAQGSARAWDTIS